MVKKKNMSNIEIPKHQPGAVWHNRFNKNPTPHADLSREKDKDKKERLIFPKRTRTNFKSSGTKFCGKIKQRWSFLVLHTNSI